MKAVTIVEFLKFLDTYPRKLERDVLAICEPPRVQFNDFTLGNWPQSVVAQHSFEDREMTQQCSWQIKDIL